MELKLATSCAASADILVLIVPSGIETCLTHITYAVVPVLIVPSGIETLMKHTGKMCSGVLIVPSGIETSELIQLYSLRQSINCT